MFLFCSTTNNKTPKLHFNKFVVLGIYRFSTILGSSFSALWIWVWLFLSIFKKYKMTKKIITVISLQNLNLMSDYCDYNNIINNTMYSILKYIHQDVKIKMLFFLSFGLKLWKVFWHLVTALKTARLSRGWIKIFHNFHLHSFHQGTIKVRFDPVPSLFQRLTAKGQKSSYKWPVTRSLTLCQVDLCCIM